MKVKYNMLLIVLSLITLVFFTNSSFSLFVVATKNDGAATIVSRKIDIGTKSVESIKNDENYLTYGFYLARNDVFIGQNNNQFSKCNLNIKCIYNEPEKNNIVFSVEKMTDFGWQKVSANVVQGENETTIVSDLVFFDFKKLQLYRLNIDNINSDVTVEVIAENDGIFELSNNEFVIDGISQINFGRIADDFGTAPMLVEFYDGVVLKAELYLLDDENYENKIEEAEFLVMYNERTISLSNPNYKHGKFFSDDLSHPYYNKEIKIRVLVPKNFYVENFNLVAEGDIKISSDQQKTNIETMNITSRSGSLKAVGLSIQKAAFKSMTNVNIENCVFEEELYVDNGNWGTGERAICITSTFAGNLKASNNSDGLGIMIKDVEILNKTDIKGLSGAIDLVNVKQSELDITTSIVALNITFDAVISSKTNLNIGAAITIKANCKLGKLTLEYLNSWSEQDSIIPDGTYEQDGLNLKKF